MHARFVFAFFYLCLTLLSPFSIAENSNLPPTKPALHKHNNANTLLTAHEKQWISQNPVIIVGGSPDWTPFNFADSTGKHTGLAHDYLTLISQYTGLTFEYSIAPWIVNLQNIQTGKVDILPTAYRNPEREEFLSFSEPYFNALDYFFIHDSLQVQTLDDLNGKTAAIPKGYAHIKILQQHFPEIKILLVDTFGEAIDAVLERRADILYDTYGALVYTLKKEGINTIIPFKSTRSIGKHPIHIVTSKSNPTLLGIIDKGLLAISSEQKQKISERWLGKKSEDNLGLTIAEKKWLKEHPTIKYAAETDWAPYDFVNLLGQHDGLSKDYIDVISNKLNVKFVPVIDTWNNLLKRIKLKQIDLLPAVYISEDKKQYLSFTMPYQANMGYIFTHENVVIKKEEDLNNKTLAIPKGYSSLALIKKTYPNINIIEVDNMANAVSAIIEEKADFLIDSYPVINFYLKDNGITTIKPYKPFKAGTAHYLHMGALQENDILISIINKVMKTIPQQLKNQLKAKWLDDRDNTLTKQIQLTIEEKEWLEKHPTITIAGNPKGLPYEAKHKNNKYIGMVPDYLKLIEQHLNITFKYIPTESWKESHSLANSGDVDILSTTTNSSPNSKLTTTQNFFSSPIVIVMKDSQRFIEGINSIKHKKIALTKGIAYSQHIKDKYPDTQFILVASIEEGLTAVSTDKADAFLEALPILSHSIAEMGLNNLRIVGTTEFTANVNFAVTPKVQPLASILNKALAVIPASRKQEIVQKWGEHQLVTKIDYQLILKIIAAFLLILLFIVIWNRKLRNEVALRKEAQIQTNALLSNIPQQVIVTAVNGDIITVNNKVREDYNLGDKEVSHLNISSFYHDINDRDKIQAQLKSHGKVEQLIIPFKKHDGLVHSMMISVIPIKYNRKPVFLTIAVDISERIEMEEALEKAKHTAEMANNAKSEFLANMSHEIRTPMNAIIGFTELLNEQVTDKKLKTFVKTIQSAGNSLLTLINDILDLSKVEAGKLSVINEPTNIHYLCEEIGNVFLMKIKHKNIDLIINIDEDLPYSLLLDKSRLRQILFNLVGNAVKFTDTGMIRLNVSIENKSTTKLDLIITVEDSGIGISDEDQQFIFNSFHQREGQNYRKYGGTGLGLTITKRLTELMNGTISVDSTLGQGSKFILSLKSVEIDDKQRTNNCIEQAPTNSQLDFLGATILLVDDVEDNRNLLIEVFAPLSVQLLSAENGKEAVECAKNNHVDLILMDIRMPEMDGYEAAQIIKTHQPNLPIIALTASVMRDDYERQRRENFDGYLRKPVLQKDLTDELKKHINYELIIEDNNIPTSVENAHVDLTLTNQELYDELSQKYAQHCQKIQKSNQVKEIFAFAKDLEAWATSNNERSLLCFAQELYGAADIFDINAMKSLLNEFILFTQPH